MKKSSSYMNLKLLSIFLLFIDILPMPAQTTENQQEDPNAAIFMNYFKQNWDDIHDVIMRFHNDNPGLKGVVYINMNWQQGKLFSASADNNETGDPAFGLALIEAMNKWQIPGLTDNWITTLPIRTAIYGSNDPMFNECGIFTGNVSDSFGNPVKGARIILMPGNNLNERPDTIYTNREGIFICTLVQPGDWQVECSKDGYLSTIIEKLAFEKGKHTKRSIIMKVE